MQDIFFLLLLIVVGIISGFLNVMAGGGSAISLPLLIFLGLDSPLANGTNRLAIFIQTISSILSFKQEKLFEFKTSLKMDLLHINMHKASVFLSIRSQPWRYLLGPIILTGNTASHLPLEMPLAVGGPPRLLSEREKRQFGSSSQLPC